MGNVIETMQGGPLKDLKFGVVGLGLFRDGPGTPKSQIADGDTISSHPQAADDLGVRFLGVDAPEKAYRLPGETAFKALDHQDWQDFLSDPLNEAKYGTFTPAMTPALKAHITSKTGAAAATNHRKHALEAKKRLVELVEMDMAALGQTKDTFRFFLAFAHDAMDGYGRLLCYINRHQTDEDDNAPPRPPFYQERMLETGHVAPFFMWPNVDPFIKDQLKNQSLLNAVLPPNTTEAQIEAQAPRLKLARNAVKAARAGHKGIFAVGDELALLASEVRFLSSRHPNRRWVIDLSAGGNTLIRPQNYFTVPNYEDRLYIPEEFVALFVEQGWQKQP